MTLTDYFVTNVQLQKEWSYDRNTVSTDDLTPHTRTKVWWYCDKGHEWQESLDSRVCDGGSCPYCAEQAGIPGANGQEEVASEIVKLWHPTRNGSLKPTDVASGSSKQLWWQCADGHVWRAAIYSRTRKKSAGCPVCTGAVKRQKKENPRVVEKSFAGINN